MLVGKIIPPGDEHSVTLSWSNIWLIHPGADSRCGLIRPSYTYRAWSKCSLTFSWILHFHCFLLYKLEKLSIESTSTLTYTISYRLSLWYWDLCFLCFSFPNAVLKWKRNMMKNKETKNESRDGVNGNSRINFTVAVSKHGDQNLKLFVDCWNLLSIQLKGKVLVLFPRLKCRRSKHLNIQWSKGWSHIQW